MKREWNQSADRLASTSLLQERGTIFVLDLELQDLTSLELYDKQIVPEKEDRALNMAEITRPALRRRRRPGLLSEEVVTQMRIERIKQSQEE